MKGILLFCATALLPILILAQPGVNDPTFNTFDNGTYGDGSGFNEQINDIIVQPDGKIIVAGGFNSFNGTAAPMIARLNPDGLLDTTFNPGTGFNSVVFSIALQPDGKIIAAGFFTAFNGTTKNRIVRLNADGSLDPSFTIGTGFNSWVNEITLQSDGKILAVGEFSSYNGTSRTRLIRLNTNGTVDLTLNPGSGFNEQVSAVTVQPDGQILIGGGFWTYNGTNVNDLIRLNPDGSLDPTLAYTGTGFSNDVYRIVVQPDGKIIAGGQFTTFNNVNRRRIARLNSDGTLDTSFSPGSAFDQTVRAISLQADGKVIVGGDFTQFNGNVRNNIARLNSDGSMDASFNFGDGCDNNVYSAPIEADGEILIGGRFTSVNGTARVRLARLNPDGNLITTFNPGAGFNAQINTSTIQTDGKIIVGGLFTAFNGLTGANITRLNTDGSCDTSLNTGTGFNNEVLTVAIQPDGKILVGGEFASFNGVQRKGIARLNTDGSLDLSFDPGAGVTNLTPVQTIAVQPSGKILAGGDFSTFNGTAVKRIVRLNTDGSVDPTFVVGSGFNGTVHSIAVNPVDGSITAGGSFSTFSGQPRNCIARLTANGGLDVSFSPGTGFNMVVRSVSLQPDGKIIAGGDFIQFNGTARNYIARINNDGTLDATFNPGTGFNARLYSTAVQTDNKIIVAGNFGSYNGITRNRIARLLNACPIISSGESITNVICVGGTTGEINLTPGGGTGPYSFSWNDGSTSEDRTGISAGTYTVTISDTYGCNTTINGLVAQPAITLSGSANVTNVSCFGGSNAAIDLTPSGGTFPYTFDWGNGITTEDPAGLTAGTYHVTITDVSGCATIGVTVTQPMTALSVATAVTNVSCFGSSNGTIDLTPGGGTFPYTFDWGNGITSEDRFGLADGTYSVTITDANGCSMISSLSVTEPAAITGSFSTTTCGAYTWNGQTYNTPGSHVQVLTNANGCDSTVTLTLTINSATSASMTQTACNSYTLNGQTYSSSGTYLQNLTNTNGCDSILTLNLTINNANSASMTQTACNSYTLNGQTYTSGGTYIQHLTNVAGCDSTLTLNLTITNASANSIAQTACDSYTLNGQTYTASGTYIQQLTNMVGCDSTLTLNLTITNSTISSITPAVCDSYTLNGQMYTASGTYLQNLTNAAGCDSTLTLNLTINTSPNMTVIDNNDATITASSADTYQWLDCSTGYAIAGATSQTFLVTVNGTYAVVGTSNAGCSDTSNCVTIDYMGVQEQSLMNITLMPNPTQDLVSIQFEGSQVILVIFDSQGKSLKSQSINSGQQVSLINFADGIYFFEFTTPKGLMTKKIIKN